MEVGKGFLCHENIDFCILNLFFKKKKINQNSNVIYVSRRRVHVFNAVTRIVMLHITSLAVSLLIC